MAPPKQIEIGPTPETGRRKFIDQHEDVGRLNKVNLAGLYRLEAKSVETSDGLETTSGLETTGGLESLKQISQR
ncbi:hypothetical protein TNCV_2368961 [Trichonephila clavipes]|nr:hypothetical protein TNCV_2368961 [Trichonephila clavipes]